MKTLKFIFVALLVLFSLNSFSQETHTYSLTTDDLSITDSDTIQVGDSIKFTNSLGYIANISYSIDGGSSNTVSVVDGGDIYESKVVSTNSFFVTVSEGFYSKTINFTVTGSTSGITENTVNYSVYPNPTTDFLNIDGVDVTSVKVFDMSGKLVVSENTNRVNVSDLPSGYYTLVVNETSSVRFIKK